MNRSEVYSKLLYGYMQTSRYREDKSENGELIKDNK